jgi:hypothetical protein
MKYLAKRYFAHPSGRAKAMRMPRLIVHGDTPAAAIRNHLLDRVDAAIEEVDFPPADGEPGAADNSRSPIPYCGDRDIPGIINHGADGIQKMVGIERPR